MREILKSEDHVPVPPMVMDDPFYRMIYIMKQEIRKHKWIEAEHGRHLIWDEACTEWMLKHQADFEKFIRETRIP